MEKSVSGLTQCQYCGTYYDKNHDCKYKPKTIEHGKTIEFPVKLGTVIGEEIVHHIEYEESLGFDGRVFTNMKIHLRDIDETGPIFCSHPYTLEEFMALMRRYNISYETKEV